ncbi:hypothetical protein GW17_00029323 [Ensete ventricosum]|nr:hypothetical protein GW17_00029323 [Ensete ventricosum]
MPALDVGLEHGIVGVVNGVVLGDPHLDRAPYHEVVDGVRIVLDQCCWIFVEPEDSARRGSACMRIINLVGCGARGKLEVVAGSVMPRWSRIPSLVQWIKWELGRSLCRPLGLFLGVAFIPVSRRQVVPSSSMFVVFLAGISNAVGVCRWLFVPRPSMLHAIFTVLSYDGP